MRLTVTDTAGQTATAQQPVQVRPLRLKSAKAAKAAKTVVLCKDLFWLFFFVVWTFLIFKEKIRVYIQ